MRWAQRQPFALAGGPTNATLILSRDAALAGTILQRAISNRSPDR